LLVPRDDVAIFTIGALPRTEAGLQAALAAHTAVFHKANVSPAKAVELTVSAAHEALAGGGLTRGELSAAITQQLPKPLRAWCEPCKAHHVPEMLFRMAGVHGELVIERDGKSNTYVRADRALRKRPKDDPKKARAELLRRYMRCFGPSTSADSGAWIGIAAAEAREDWNELANDLIEVRLDGRKAWIHSDDAAVLHDPPTTQGVRLLPPYDAYLDQRDRGTLISDKALHKRVWRAIGNPGVVLRGGAAVATWRTRKKGKRLVITVEPFGALPGRAKDEIAAEADLLAPFRESTSVETVFG
jgi:hypothetical protein